MDDILKRGVVNIIPDRDSLEKELKSGKKLNVYLGIDPTATKIHLGHAVTLRKLKLFSELGHNVTFLVGDFTAIIGDTSDKESERPSLTPEEIAKNFSTYKEQASKILDFNKIQLKYNSQWLKELKIEDMILLSKLFSVNSFVGRELIKKRLDEGKRVGLDEVLYPILQGYDSYQLHTDLQIGGADQIFNMQAGRTIINALDHKESFILSTAYLTGTDGRKMSKSWGNAIWLSDTPNDMYRKIMSINDSLIEEYLTLATSLPMQEVANLSRQAKTNPLEVKKRLSYIIVSELYSPDDAEKGKETFESTVQEGKIPENIPEYKVENENENILDILVNSEIVGSKSEAKRVIEQGGVEINGKKIDLDSIMISVQNGMVVKIGKYKYLKLLINS